MRTIDVNIKQNPYQIYIGKDIFGQFERTLQKHQEAKQIAVITSQPIFDLHGARLMNQLNSFGKVVTLFVPDGEKAKSYDELISLHTKLLGNKFERTGLIIAFGGGVIGDLAGFVAATYLRGVPFVQVPTTLLAQVDSSIGGKVGINHPLGKNLVGAFKQPLFVFSDTHLLQTLPDPEVRCGMGEVIKYGLSLNRELFEYLEIHLDQAIAKDPEVLNYLVEISAREKARIVAEDEREKNLRMVLNFGHTFGHALEAEFAFGKLKHGEAVILGMKCALNYALNQNILSYEDSTRMMRLLDRVPIAIDLSQINPAKLVVRMTIDKKVKDGKIRLVLTEGIGLYRFAFADSNAALEEAFKILFK